jgi:Fe-S-cluster containining protein
MRAYCLSIHVVYRCAHAGACCTAAWPIPIERVAARALAGRGLWTDALRLVPVDRPDEPLLVGRKLDGACMFYERECGGLCAIHRRAGPALMPEACRTFPRVALRDPRGAFVTLSHFCPTAARLLLRPQQIAIVAAPPSISLDGGVNGLDATAVLPPLLRPGMLMDWDAYAAWERQGVAVLDSGRSSARDAVSIIAAATRDACRWSPAASGSLEHAVEDAFARARAEHEPEAPPRPFEYARRAFLAAHLFASWAPYGGGGVRAVVEALRTALTLLGEHHADERAFIEAARAADLKLRHT